MDINSINLVNQYLDEMKTLPNSTLCFNIKDNVYDIVELFNTIYGNNYNNLKNINDMVKLVNIKKYVININKVDDIFYNININGLSFGVTNDGIISFLHNLVKKDMIISHSLTTI